MPAGVVILGAGQAGFQTAASLREGGYQEPITLVGDEPHVPYYRPPLSKGFVAGKEDLASVELRPAAFYQDHRIDLRAGQKAVAIDRAAKTARLASGAAIPYDHLVLAVGARNRLLPVPGAHLDGVFSLRTLDESSAIKQRLQAAQTVVVIGGGFIGLELAAVARLSGKQVTVLEMLPRLMSRAVAPIVSDFFRNLHHAQGASIVCGCQVSEIIGFGSGRVQQVRMADGAHYPADLVLVGIGIMPNIELARDAGLPVANGIVVDEFLQTSDPAIYAIGDCAEYPNHFTGTRLRLESVQNAADQAQHIAAAILGRREPYRALPWFWTDQYDAKLQMAGLSAGYDRIVLRGSLESRKLSAFYFGRGHLVAIDSINRPLDHILGRKLIAAGAPLTPEQAADESFDLRKLAQSLPHPA